MIFVFVRCESSIRDGESYFSQHEVSSLEEKTFLASSMLNLAQILFPDVVKDSQRHDWKRKFIDIEVRTVIEVIILKLGVVRNSWTQLEMDRFREEKGWKIFHPREIVVPAIFPKGKKPLQTSEIEINRSTTRG